MDDHVEPHVTAENLSGVPEVQDICSEPSSMANIMEEMSETAAPDS